MVSCKPAGMIPSISGCIATKPKAYRGSSAFSPDAVEKPLFSPLTPQQAYQQLDQHLHQPPPQATRWRLATLLKATSQWLKLTSLSGLWRLLHRLGFSLQRAREHIHSPDQAYADKYAYLLATLYQASREETTPILFADAMSYYNQATVAPDWCPTRQQPLADLAVGGSKSYPLFGALNARTGQLTTELVASATVDAFVGFLQKLRATYPQAPCLYVVLDNGPIHVHPTVIEALQPQHYPFAYVRPPSWKHAQPSGVYKDLQLPIQLVFLPTYSSWLNPIERVWKQAKQQVHHLHGCVGRPQQLGQQLQAFFAQYEQPSEWLRRASGLTKPDGLYAQALGLSP